MGDSSPTPNAGRSAIPHTALLIAYHFPPIHGSSGLQRTLRFAQHLQAFGWRPIVLTVTPGAYTSVVEARGNEVPSGVEVFRAFGLDTARHLSVFGRYPLALALPDRWSTWRFAAVPLAMRIIARRSVDVLWSTFPIATAHRIGLEVARRSALPWVAEFRDPMWQGHYPPEPEINAAWRRLESDVFESAQAVVVTTPGALKQYRQRFPAFPSNRLKLIENGYDEETFKRAEADRAESRPDNSRPRPITLLHSGVVYRSERDPTQLFAAVAALKRCGRLTADDYRIVFRASGDEVGYGGDVAALGIDDIVQLEPPIDYLDALREMLDADAVLLLQAANCNAQIPAKLYEYLRAGRPILALTDPAGDTARTLDAAGAGRIARLDSREEIEAVLVEFVRDVHAGAARRPTAETVAAYSRKSQAGLLASVLDELVDETVAGVS